MEEEVKYVEDAVQQLYHSSDPNTKASAEVRQWFDTTRWGKNGNEKQTRESLDTNKSQPSFCTFFTPNM